MLGGSEGVDAVGEFAHQPEALHFVERVVGEAIAVLVVEHARPVGARLVVNGGQAHALGERTVGLRGDVAIGEDGRQ